MKSVFAGREPALAKHLEGMNVLTVGDLCSLTEQEVHHLPIAQPKVLNVRRAMNKFVAMNQPSTGIDFVVHCGPKNNCGCV